MDEIKANQLMDEAWFLFDNREEGVPSPSDIGGIYCRLADVLSQYICPLLSQFSDDYAMSLMENHGMIIPFQNRMLPDGADHYLPSVNEHFMFYKIQPKHLRLPRRSDEFQAMVKEWLEAGSKTRVTSSKILAHFMKYALPFESERRAMGTRISLVMRNIGWTKCRDPVTRNYFFRAPVTYWVGDDEETTG